MIRRLTHFANVDIRVKSELAELHGERLSVLQGVTVRNRRVKGQLNYLRPDTSSCSEALSPTPDGSMDVFDSMRRATFLPGCRVPTDTNSLGRSALQTSLPRVFAIGDARSGSTKQVAPAVGEGAAVVAQIHSVLSTSATVV